MANKADITPEILRQLLTVDDATGRLFWEERTPENCVNELEMRRFNARYAGKEAFTAKTTQGYRAGSVLKQSLLAHRVVFALSNGFWPADMVDHVNGDKADNRPINLREANRSQNLQNSRPKNGGRSKYKGVCWHARDELWHARITVNKNRISLGFFKSEEAAARAYALASAKYHKEFSRLE